MIMCSFCQVVYYDRPRLGIRHYGNNFLGWLQVCLTASPETKHQTACGSMLYDDIKGWLCWTGCSNDGCIDVGGTFSDIAAENRALLQTRQRGLAAVMQRLAGVCLATFWLTYHVKCWEGIACTAMCIKTQAVEQQIEWLMGAPAGLKLHTELSHVLGSMAQIWLRYAEAAYMLIGRNTMVALTGKDTSCLAVTQRLTAVMGVIGGLTMQIAFLHDLLCLLAMPLVIAYTAYAKLYAVQLHYTLLMWRLMRGNRDALAVLRRQYGLESSPRERRREISHHKEEDGLALEQMIVGVLLFTPLLFLLPTTFVYYVLVLLLHTAVLMACWALQMSSRLLHRSPAYFLWCWAFKPGLVPGAIAFVPTTMQLQLPGLTNASQVTFLRMVQGRCMSLVL
ncbi:hypothetical protein WJX77_001992 [Trebouxia sp. C0004]